MSNVKDYKLNMEINNTNVIDINYHTEIIKNLSVIDPRKVKLMDLKVLHYEVQPMNKIIFELCKEIDIKVRYISF